MPNYAPVNLQAIDENGQKLLDISVPFELQIDVQQIMERAFVLMQTPAVHDPFNYSVEYYGYSEAAQYPGYLGYELESLCGKPSNAQYYWELSVNGVTTLTGADTTLPGPGSTVLWKYTAIPADSAALTPRATVVQSRRTSRASANT